MYLLLNSLNRSVAEIFDTYIYTAGLKNGQLSFSTAMGLFKGVVGLFMVILANKIAKKLEKTAFTKIEREGKICCSH